MDKGSSLNLETFFSTAWMIWFNRNQIIYESSFHSPIQTWESARRLALNYKGAISTSPQQMPLNQSKWFTPPIGFFKINVDGATSKDNKASSIGAIIKDSNGLVSAAVSRILLAQYLVEEAEAKALDYRVLLAQDLNISHIITESDALSIVQTLLSKQTNGVIGHLIQGILSALALFRSWKIQHLEREFNRAAHELAQQARYSGVTQCWRG